MTQPFKLNSTGLFLKHSVITKKIFLIPPVVINGKFATCIKTKANIFNNFFAKQCTPLKNDRVLPAAFPDTIKTAFT